MLTDQLNGRSRAHEQDLDRLRTIDQENRGNKQMVESLKMSLEQAERSFHDSRVHSSRETDELRKTIPQLNARIANL